ncbi:MAG: tRNA (guanine(10)-N(2))-dimethyltransferase [Candidatus Norongarragalinales archaeon]
MRKKSNAVFFNPRMNFNRSFSALALRTALALEILPKKPVVADVFCAGGARGIAYAAATGNAQREIVFVDASPQAIREAKLNAKKAGIKRVKFACDEANAFLAKHAHKFNWVDLDPFGTPAPFLENALRAVRYGGVVSVTATDLASSAGRYPAPCLRNYAAHPLYCEFSHETALRIILGALARTAARLELGVEPLACWYQEHYVKIIARVREGARKADESLHELGFVNYCPACRHREESGIPKEKCGVCFERNDFAGPLWLSETNDATFLEKMVALAENEKEKNFASLLAEEKNFPPWFFDLHSLASKLRVDSPNKLTLIEKLKTKGFRASRTHYSGTAIKTNASYAQLKKILQPR